MQDRESRLPQVVFLVGVAVALSGNFLSIPIVMKAGFVCICLAILLVGIEMLLTGRAVFTAWPGGRSWGHYERFSGLPARLWGILFLIFGGFLGALTLADIVFPSGAEAVWAGLMDTPRGMGLFL